MRNVPLADFGKVLRAAAVAAKEAQKAAMEYGAAMIAQEAKDLIGTEYPGWPALADSTVERKTALGQVGRISPTDPEYATGEVRATIGSQVLDDHNAVAGSPDQVAVYQEFGTSRMPPRSIFASAASRKGEDAAKALGEAVQHALAGEALPWRP